MKTLNDDKLFDLVVLGTRARAQGQWERVAKCALEMATRVTPAVELLARFVADLIDDEDYGLAAVVWTKLVDALVPRQAMQLMTMRAAQPAS